MKNKKMTWLLLLSVAAVWGIIFYRIFTAVDSQETLIPKTSFSKSSYESLDDYKMKDSFRLSLHYRDPFLGGEVKPEKALDITSAAQPGNDFRINSPAPAPEVNWLVVRYTGYIVNREMKRIVAIMNINSKEYMLSEGQKAQGVVIIRNYKDSVKVSYQGKTKFIRIQ